MPVQVDTVAVDIIHGRPTRPKERVQIFVVPGRDGLEAQRVGASESEANLTLVKYDTLANIETFLNDIEKLAGKVVSITDNFGTTYNNVLIAEINVGTKRAIQDGTGTVKGRGEIGIRGLRLEV